MADALRAERLAQDEGRDDLMAEALRQVARVEWRLANYGPALAKLGSSRKLLEPHGKSKSLVLTLNLIGAVHFAKNEFDLALESYLASLATSRELGDEKTAALAQNNIGLVYWALGQRDKAFEALSRVLSTHERLGEKRNIAGTCCNVGLVLIELGRPGDAMPYLERALQIDIESDDLHGQAKVMSQLGYAHEALGDPKAAFEYHQRALALRERIGDKDGIQRSGSVIAALQLQGGDPAAATETLEKALALAAETGSPGIEAKLLAELAKAREASGDLAGALAAHRRYHQLEADLSDEKARNRVAELQTQYEAAERERELVAVAGLAESRRDKVVWLVVGSALLGASLLLVSVLFLQRVRAQRLLVESEQRYRTLFQTSVVPTLLVESDTRAVVDLNEPARKLCAIPPAPARLTIDQLQPEWLRVAVCQLFATDDVGGHVTLDDCRVESSGRLRYSEVRGSTVAIGGRACRLVSVRDTTESREHEEARLREEKMRSLGVLAGGIAHDFNNALTGIIGHVELARDSIERDAMLDRAAQAAIGARRLTSQLLAFARGGQPVRRVVDLGEVLREAAELAGSGSHMRIEVDVVGDLWCVEVDVGQFGQVVSNLVINALQATTTDGRLQVRASNFRGDPTTAVPGLGERYVRIDFQDNGTGIPEGLRDRVFDPYFTTKVGGSGLGLATAFAICRNHGGTLSLQTREGVGTTFSVFLPAAAGARPLPELTPCAAEPRGGGSVLVLEDEALLREVYQRTLERWGFRVETVADGRAAVRRYLERLRAGRPFDLLIVDLTIPGGMGGLQALTEIRAHHRDVRAIVASGYSDDPTMAHYREAGFVAALCKPFTRSELGRVVHAVVQVAASPSGPPCDETARSERPPGEA